MKKIISIIVLSIVGLLVATTITLAIVPVSTYDAIKGSTANGKRADYVAIYRDGLSNYYMPSNEDYTTVSNKIYDLYNKSLKASVLSSFFQGAMSYEEGVDNTTTSNIDTVLKTAGKIYVEFVWENPQTLYFDGEKYETPNSKNNKEVSFTSLAVEVTDNEAYDTCTIYVISTETTGSSTSRKCNYKITTLAHQSELYDYIMGLSIKGGMTE